MSFEIALTCLALNVYMEARGETIQGQHAVALVTLNRVAAHDGAKDICDVVFERAQFSWTITDAKNGALLPNKRPDRTSAAWKRSMQSAIEALELKDFTCGATYYHATAALPRWSKSFVRVAQYGNHYFYAGKYANYTELRRPNERAVSLICKDVETPRPIVLALPEATNKLGWLTRFKNNVVLLKDYFLKDCK